MTRFPQFGRFLLAQTRGHSFAHSGTFNLPIVAGDSGFGATNSPTSQSVLRVGKIPPFNLRTDIFMKFLMPGVQPGSKIKSSEIGLSNSGANSGGTLDIACLEPDGRWDVKYESIADVKAQLESGRFIMARTVNSEAKMNGQITGGFNGMNLLSAPSDPAFVLGETGAATSDANLQFRLNSQYNDSISGTRDNLFSIAQLIKISTISPSPNITRVNFNARRVGSTFQSGKGIRCRLWQVDPVTFGNHRIVNTSNQLAHLSISTTVNTLSLIFSSPTVATVGDCYIAEIYDTSDTPNSPGNYIEPRADVDVTSGTLDSDEKLYVSSIRSAFHMGCYPLGNDLPYLYSGNSGTTIHKAPHGSILTRTFSNTANLAENRFDVTKIVQEWVNSQQYKDMHYNQIGFTMASADHFGNNSTTNFVKGNLTLQPNLYIEWEPRRILIT